MYDVVGHNRDRFSVQDDVLGGQNHQAPALGYGGPREIQVTSFIFVETYRYRTVGTYISLNTIPGTYHLTLPCTYQDSWCQSMHQIRFGAWILGVEWHKLENNSPSLIIEAQ